MSKVFRFSTYGGASATNAQRALTLPLQLTPIAQKLEARGYIVEPGETGYLWGATKTGFLWKNEGKRLEAGDFGARLTREAGVEVISHVYEVVAVMEDRDLPGDLGIVWDGEDQEGWPVSIVFGEPLVFSPGIPYALVEAQLNWQTLSTPPPAYFVPKGPVPSDGEETLLALRELAGLPTVQAAHWGTDDPEDPEIFSQRAPGVARTQRSRTGQRSFKLEVLARYGAHCGACDITGARLLEAAHLIDEGWSRSHASVGIPMCPNHHRLMDKGILRIRDGRWCWHDPEYRHTLTRGDLSHLLASPAPKALTWKQQHPVAGKFKG